MNNHDDEQLGREAQSEEANPQGPASGSVDDAEIADSGKTQAQSADASSQEADGGDARIARREAMRKAAIGAAVAGAVWAAPKVAGLSIVPDYASAATGTGSFTFTTRSADAAPTYYDSVGDDVPACGADGGSYWNVRAPDNPGNTAITAGNTNGTARSVTGPIGPGGSATLNVASGPNNQAELNETRSDISVSINIDPPWNRCRVSSVQARKCNNSDATININNNPGPDVTNPAPFTVGFTIPGPQPSYLSYVQVVVSCT